MSAVLTCLYHLISSATVKAPRPDARYKGGKPDNYYSHHNDNDGKKKHNGKKHNGKKHLTLGRITSRGYHLFTLHTYSNAPPFDHRTRSNSVASPVPPPSLAEIDNKIDNKIHTK